MLKKMTMSLLICFCFSLTAFANEEAEIIALEIRNLSTSVDRLTQLLYEQGQQKEQNEILRKLDIAVAYLNFRSRRIEMLERDRQNNQTSKNRLEDILQQLESRLEQLEDENIGEQDEDNLAAQNDTREQINMFKQRLARIDESLFDFDNQIVELRNQLDDVESFVERNLEL
ncbi:hypothetical protein SAMN02745165_01842 [Malonomonas rubra DSM 5091]|uniref:Uncharacterized protein n=1 Tax=Malonomonas rubra DSM 5091 TaxID=1122189 RepID=A0A1M6HHW1_MALRU|nr:hypothetical protein [Malonomonas rubra]SHJ21797.1 hypothetical protein SAMN02745165_01842 [Malonomonas rubra DSM 5091]